MSTGTIASSVADLVLVQAQVRSVVERLMRDGDPDVVGLSVMTFQRKTALRTRPPDSRAQAGR